jgi:plasmid stabilization system protein ParE
MSVRFILAPQAALDLVEIWRYIKEQTSLTIADRVESAIREKIACVLWPEILTATSRDTPASSKFFTALRLRSWNSRPGTPAFLQADFQTLRMSTMARPS